MKLLNIKQAAAMLKVSQNKVFNLIFSGRVKGVKDRYQSFIVESEVEKYILQKVADKQQR